MKFAKVLFIGLGGAGQRHLRILHQLMPAGTVFGTYRRTGMTPLLKSNFDVDASNSVETAYGLQIFSSLAQAFDDKPDLTVVSTPTAFHLEPMMMAMSVGSGVLVEKPWSENLHCFREFRDGMLAKQLPFLISFQRRYHPQILRTKQLISTGYIGRPIAAEFTVYSDVRSWHAYEDWHGLYAVRSDMGGGVLLTEIHEIDLANWFFGLPKSVFCSGGNRSAEKLTVEDTVQLTLIYDDFSVQITFCFMHKSPSRSFHIAGTDGDISWDGIKNSLSLTPFEGMSSVHTEAYFNNDSMFVAQAEQFLGNWKQEDSLASLVSASESLSLVDAARRSMRSGRAELVEHLT